MTITIAVLKETQPHEKRVALVPDIVPRLIKLGCVVRMETGGADAIKLPADAYADVAMMADRATLLADADIVLAVQPPDAATIEMIKPGAILVCFVYPDSAKAQVKSLLKRKITCFAMERVPRISRAQSMDALSSQSSLAGYYGVELGATLLNRILPRMTTAAGVIGPAKVLVMGLGVAGLQAIATAHRLGAMVEGYDVRPETAEQAASLGATFVSTGIDARGDGGYARELTEVEKAKVTKVLTDHIQDADLIITTAAIPGRPSPKLISKDQITGMKPGSVIVDLSAEGGGNCEASAPGKTTHMGLVTIIAPLNVASMLTRDASALYAKNQYNLLALILKNGAIAIDWDDAVLSGTALTHDGKLVADPVDAGKAPPTDADKPTPPDAKAA
ncbi:MAG: NAD(P) transhydrogenase subunit alpha [Devosia sp.]